MENMLSKAILAKLQELSDSSIALKNQIDKVLSQEDVRAHAPKAPKTGKVHTYKLLLGMPFSGRVWEMTKHTSAQASILHSANGDKYMRMLDIPKLNNNVITITWRTRIFTLMHLAGLLIPYASKTEWLKKGLSFVEEDGKISNDTKQMLCNSVTKVEMNGRIKGFEKVIEIERLVNGFNDPEKYGYEMLVSMDAKAQNWTLYGLYFLRDKEFIKRVNIHVGEKNGLDIPTNDFNSENLELFYNIVKIPPSDQQHVSREVPKFITMTMLYGSGTATAFRKVLSEVNAADKPYLKSLFAKKEYDVKRFVNTAIPKFYEFNQLFKRLARRNRKLVYSFRFMGHPYAFGEVEKVTTNEKFIDKLISDTVKLDNYKTTYKLVENPYQLFKMSASVHLIDSALVRWVRNRMFKVYGHHIITNHDNFMAHPEIAMDMIEQYVLGLKLIYAQYNGDVLRFLVDQWGGEDMDLSFMDTPNKVGVRELVETDTTAFLNSIWAV